MSIHGSRHRDAGTRGSHSGSGLPASPYSKPLILPVLSESWAARADDTAPHAGPSPRLAFHPGLKIVLHTPSDQTPLSHPQPRHWLQPPGPQALLCKGLWGTWHPKQTPEITAPAWMIHRLRGALGYNVQRSSLSLTDSLDMSVSKLRKTVKDREA